MSLKTYLKSFRCFKSPENIKKRLIEYKIYLERARGWISLVQFTMVLVIFLKSIELPEQIEYYLYNYKFIVFPLIIVVALLVFIYIGSLDTKKGLRREEMRNNTMENPVFNEMIKKVREIHEKL